LPSSPRRSETLDRRKADEGNGAGHERSTVYILFRRRARRIPIVDGVAAGGLMGLRLARPFWFCTADITD
jgi:hypothetical protein